eukprot:Gb_34065 [translate_table: standard]
MHSKKEAKRIEAAVSVSPCYDGSNTPRCQDDCTFSSAPEDTNKRSTESDSLKIRVMEPSLSTSVLKNEQDFSWVSNALLDLPSSQEGVRNSDFISNEVKALLLLKNSGFVESSEEALAKDTYTGLSLLGAAACLSLGLTESPHGSAKKAKCTYYSIGSLKDNEKPQASNLGVNRSCPSAQRGMPHETINRCSLNLGVDLSIGLFNQSAEDNIGPQNNNDDVRMHGVTQLESGNEGITCPMDINFHKSEGSKNHEIIEKDHKLVVDGNSRNICQEVAHTNLDSTIEQNTGRDYMCFSDLSIPPQGTRLLQRRQRHVRRLPIQTKRVIHPLKQKTSIENKEQVCKFTKGTAPSGLLADLKPGIINRVRNRYQVHAIIEAALGSVKLNAYHRQHENQRDLEGEPKDIMEKSKRHQRSQTVAKMCRNANPANDVCDDQYDSDRVNSGNHLLARYDNLNEEINKPKTEERASSAWNDCLVDNWEPDDTNLLEKGSRMQLWTNYVGCHSNEKKVAAVAFQWLKVLNQDIKGRLAALKRSRKRVRTVIRDELGCNSTDQQASASDRNDCQFVQPSNTDLHDDILVNAGHDIHLDEWRSLFVQMDHSLNEEGAQLVSND